ncbi:MAG: AMP-binding protein, partial [Myxococcales bacterium]
IRKLAQGARKMIDEHRPKWGMPTVDAWLSRARDALDEIDYQEAVVQKVTDLFLPFVWQNHYVFRCDNTRALYEEPGVLSEEDKRRLPWNPTSYEWRDYWLEVHLPGVKKWVFPGLEEERKKKVHGVRTYRDMIEMFEATTHAYKTRVAFRYYNGETVDAFTFGHVDHYSARVADYLLAQGLKKGDRVMLIGANRPEWPICYFGILRAGGVAVPVDNGLTENEVVNLAKNCNAFAVLMTEQAVEKHSGLAARLNELGLATHIALFAQAMAGDPAVNDGKKKSKVIRTASSDDLASIIYTSGTTGQPKGVMLTHRNFTSLVAKLAGVYDLRPGDGVLSVLPLHHTFEFSCGLLLPFSRGAEVNYLDELTSDRLGEALEDGRITGLIGVPALFQLLHRKITQELAAKPGFVESTVESLMKLNSNLRSKKDYNFGKLLFWPIHRKFGGKIRFMVSGASALPEEVHEAFHALGFNISEGYGLTECAPVLTVTEGGNKRQKGT